jgi:hypothetical protein
VKEIRKLTLISPLERSEAERKGPRAPEAKIGEDSILPRRNSENKTPEISPLERSEAERKGQRIVEPQLDWRNSGILICRAGIRFS